MNEINLRMAKIVKNSRRATAIIPIDRFLRRTFSVGTLVATDIFHQSHNSIKALKILIHNQKSQISLLKFRKKKVA